MRFIVQSLCIYFRTTCIWIKRIEFHSTENLHIRIVNLEKKVLSWFFFPIHVIGFCYINKNNSLYSSKVTIVEILLSSFIFTNELYGKLEAKKCWYLYLIEDNLHPLKSIIVNFKFLCIQTKKYFYNCTSIICVVWFQVFLKQTCIHTFCSQSLPLLSFPFYDKPPKKMLLKQSNCLSILYYN